MVVGVKVHQPERQIEEVFGPSGCDRLGAQVRAHFFTGMMYFIPVFFSGPAKLATVNKIILNCTVMFEESSRTWCCCRPGEWATGIGDGWRARSPDLGDRNSPRYD